MIPPRTILAATDFSDGSRAAIGFAARLARYCRAALHIVHAEDPLLAAPAGQSGFDLATQTREELPLLVASAPPAADCGPQLHAPTEGRAPLLVLGKKPPESRGAAPGTIAYRVRSLAQVPVLMYVEP